MEDYKYLEKNTVYLWEMRNGEKFLARLVEFLDDSKISVDLEISGDDRRESEYYIIHPNKARLAREVPQMSLAQFDIHTIGETFKFTMRPRQALFPNAAMNYQTFVGRVVGTSGGVDVVRVDIDLDDEKQERVEIAVERIAFVEPVEEEEEKEVDDGTDANGNAGCLYEKQCPNCGQAKEFSIIATSQLCVDDDGYQEARNVDYDDCNEASCMCGFMGTVGDLETAYAENH